MIGIFYTDGTYTEVEGTTAGLDDDGHLICWDDHGAIVSRIPADTLLAYGRADVTRALTEEMRAPDVEPDTKASSPNP